MRWLLAICLLNSCSLPVHQSFGALNPRKDPSVVQVLVLPPIGNQPEASTVDTLMVSLLEQDPRVHIERTELTDRHAACDYLRDHGMDYAARVEVRAGSYTPPGQCRETWKYFWTHRGPATASCSDTITTSSAMIELEIYDEKYCGKDDALTHSWGEGREVGGDHWQALLDQRMAEATPWMQANLPHYFAHEVRVIAAAGDRATVPIGRDAGVREGDQFELYEGRDNVGYGHVTQLTATTAEVAPTFGNVTLAPGQLAVQRGRPWSVDVEPTLGASTQTSDGMTTRAGLVGAHARLHPFGSGWLVGFGVEGQLTTDAPAWLLGPELGGVLQLEPHVAIYGIGGVRLANVARDADKAAGATADAVAGAMYTSRYGFLSVEGGYQRSTQMTIARHDIDLDGPIVRASLGLRLGN